MLKIHKFKIEEVYLKNSGTITYIEQINEKNNKKIDSIETGYTVIASRYS